MNICFLYGGQGSQKKGMGKDFYENYPIFKDFYDQINLPFDLKEYSFEKSDEEISQTQYTQPLMVAFQIGVTKILNQKGIKPCIVGGLSIGEYSAIYSSGMISDNDAMIIAEKRGLAMAKKGDINCKMMAVIDADEDFVRKTCKEISETNKYPVEISNLNAPGQIVISGEQNSIDKVVSILKSNSIRKILPLKVSNAFHTSYMNDAGIELENIFKDIHFTSPQIDLGLNLDGSIYNKDKFDENDFKNIMVKQVKNTVYFQKELENIISQGVDIFVEIGFSSVIKGFLKKIDKNAKVYDIYSVETLENFLQEIQK